MRHLDHGVQRNFPPSRQVKHKIAVEGEKEHVDRQKVIRDVISFGSRVLA